MKIFCMGLNGIKVGLLQKGTLNLKVLLPITFSSPSLPSPTSQAQSEVVYSLFNMKAHIFLIANLKFCHQTLCTFGDMAETD